MPPRASSSPPTYLGADVQHQCLRLVLLHLAAAPVGQREGAGLSWGSQGLEEGERRGARARQPKQRGAAPALALHPLRNSENTHRYRGRASSGTNRRNKHKKTHNYKGFVFKMFIPLEGKGQRKHPKVLTAREAIAKEPETNGVPCCTLACASRVALRLRARCFAVGMKHFQAALTLQHPRSHVGQACPARALPCCRTAPLSFALPPQGAGAVWRRRALRRGEG